MKRIPSLFLLQFMILFSGCYKPLEVECCDDCCNIASTDFSSKSLDFFSILKQNNSINYILGSNTFTNIPNIDSTEVNQVNTCPENPCDVYKFVPIITKKEIFVKYNLYNFDQIVIGVQIFDGVEQVFFGYDFGNPSTTDQYTYVTIDDVDSIYYTGDVLINGNLFNEVYTFIHQTDTFYFNKNYGLLKYWGQSDWIYVDP